MQIFFFDISNVKDRTQNKKKKTIKRFWSQILLNVDSSLVLEELKAKWTVETPTNNFGLD